MIRMFFASGSEREMSKALRKLADVSGKTVSTVIPAQARLYCADLATNTKPVGKGNKGNLVMLRKRIEQKVQAIYMPVGSAVAKLKDSDPKDAKAFQRLMRANRYTEAAKLFNERSTHGIRVVKIGTFDGGDLHRRQKFKGKVRECMIVTNYAPVRAYMRGKVKLVGYAKGGFATAARQLGGVRGIPGYATRQKSPGHGSIRGTGRQMVVTIRNDVRHIRDALDKGAEDRATQFRKRQIEAVVRRIMDRKQRTVSPSLR